MGWGVGGDLRGKIEGGAGRAGPGMGSREGRQRGTHPRAWLLSTRYGLSQGEKNPEKEKRELPQGN